MPPHLLPIGGMCVNCTPPPINHRDKWKEEEAEEGKQQDDEEGVGVRRGEE